MSLKAGWYPQDDGTEKFWDGSAWTDAVRATERQAAPAVPASATKPSGCLPWVAGFFVLVIVAVGFNSCSGDKEPEGPDDYSIQATCKDLVRKQLKNPSTADFSDEVQSMTSASGTVVAENALGGKVTSTYRCSANGSMVTLEAVTPR